MLSADRHASIWRLVRGPFLFPMNFKGHTCEWECFSYTQAGCVLCGVEHRCSSDNETCDCIQDDDGHVTCRITGCVVREQDHKDEWTAPARACIEPPPKQRTSAAQIQKQLASIQKNQRNGKQNAMLLSASLTHQVRKGTPCETWAFVNHVITDVLNSKITEQCRQQENRRLCFAQINVMHKEIKRQRDKFNHVNMVRVATEVVWATRKLRRPSELAREDLGRLISICTDAITHVMLKYSSTHIAKLLNNEQRKREFACSMLYLMRNGVTCRGHCVLPKIEVLTRVLPLETYLPDSFRIRAKSITEGENLLKIELRRMHQF